MTRVLFFLFLQSGTLILVIIELHFCLQIDLVSWYRLNQYIRFLFKSSLKHDNEIFHYTTIEILFKLRYELCTLVQVIISNSLVSAFFENKSKYFHKYLKKKTYTRLSFRIVQRKLVYIQKIIS